MLMLPLVSEIVCSCEVRTQGHQSSWRSRDLAGCTEHCIHGRCRRPRSYEKPFSITPAQDFWHQKATTSTVSPPVEERNTKFYYDLKKKKNHQKISGTFSKHQNAQMLGTWVKRLQTDHTNDSNHNIKCPKHFFSVQMKPTSWSGIKI